MTRQELIEGIIYLLERWEEREAVKRGEMSPETRRGLVASRLNAYYQKKMHQATHQADKDYDQHAKMFSKNRSRLKKAKQKLKMADELEAPLKKKKEIEDEIRKREKIDSRLFNRRLKKFIHAANVRDKAYDKYGRWKKHADNINTAHLRRALAGDKYTPTSTEKMLGAGRPKPQKKSWLSRILGK